MKNIAAEKLLEMGPNPNSWPAWPFLPVKNYTRKDPHFPGLCATGYVVEELVTPTKQINIRDGNIFCPDLDKDLVVASYNTWAEAVADGWVVD